MQKVCVPWSKRINSSGGMSAVAQARIQVGMAGSFVNKGPWPGQECRTPEGREWEGPGGGELEASDDYAS